MKHYAYVTKRQAQPYRDIFQQIMFEVQKLVRDNFTFQFYFIGSSARNMITYDSTTNIGFDFDINIEVNDSSEDYTPQEIRYILFNAIQTISQSYGFNRVENGKRVITIKKTNILLSSIEYGCDIAIVNNYIDDINLHRQEYINFNKKNNNYTWESQTSPFDIEDKISVIKEYKLWNEVRDLYLYKKNNNNDPNKKSRSLYAETIKEIFDQI